MKRACGVLALLAGLAGASQLDAQVGLPFVGPRTASVGVRIEARRTTFGVYAGPFGVGYGGYWCGPAYACPYPSYFSSVTIITPPVIVTPPPIVLTAPAPAEPPLADPIIANPLVIRPRQQRENPPPVPAERPPDPPLPGEQAGGFRPIRPEDRARAQMPVEPEPPAPMPPERPRLPPAGEPPPPPRPMVPDPDPKVEYARLLTLGRDAFAAQEYGRAARRFQQATRVLPAEPLAHFLLAQAEFALGRYREAVVAIHAGMRRQPDWPTARFRPLDLYGANVTDYPDHLHQLEETLARHPDDPVLLFLFAYQLWFDGRQDEARPYFRRAAERVADPAFIQRFLEIQAAPPIV